jgi:hypothetical protein
LGSSPDFYHLCLAELDALRCFTRPECLSSRAAYIAELKRLLAEPTTPSCPILSTELYQAKQRWWLASLIQEYETSSNKPDAVNPAMASGFQVERQWRGVTDPGRSANKRACLKIVAELPLPYAER